MKKYLFLFVFIASFWGVQSQDNDPVIMKVNGKEIKKSEFEYIYNKNNTESAIDKKTLPEYVELFKNFKLRVAEAEAQGLDTTAAFHKEFNEYRSVLAKPYLTFSEEDEALMMKEYESYLEFSEISHILLPFFEDGYTGDTHVYPADTLKVYKEAMVIKNKASKKGADFSALVKEYSKDPQALQTDPAGYMGWLSGARFIPVLGQAFHETKAGSVSRPIRSNFGYHLFKITGKMPTESVSAAHILVMLPQDADAVQKVDAEQKIDSIYNVLMAGSDFAEVARMHSEDRGSAAQGGELGWFEKGAMVREFEDAVFAMKNIGDISKPVRSQFGYHIIQFLGRKPYASFEESKENIRTKLNRTGYELDLKKPLIDRLKAENGFTFNQSAYDEMMKTAETDYPTGDGFYRKYDRSTTFLFSLGDVSYTIADFVDYMKKNRRSSKVLSTEFLDDRIKSFEYQELLAAEDRNLESKYPEFKNLVQEYRDGILLFEISNQQVWDRSSTDIEGLENYFMKHKDEYTWDSPRYKGYIVYVKDAKNKKKMQKEVKKMTPDDAAAYLLENYKVGDVSYVKLEKSLYKKGDNNNVDIAVFKSKNEVALPTGYEDYFVIGKLLSAPESYTDVRGQVITDYQDSLEKDWLEELNQKYPVVIYEDVLKTVK